MADVRVAGLGNWTGVSGGVVTVVWADQPVLWMESVSIAWIELCQAAAPAPQEDERWTD